MKKLFCLLPLLSSMLLKSCPKTMVPTYAYLDDHFFLVIAYLVKKNDKEGYQSSFSYKEDGYLTASIYYSCLFVEEGWNANIYLNFFGFDSNACFFYQLSNCCNSKYQGSYTDDWFEFYGKPGQYTYQAKRAAIFPDMIPVSLLENKYSSVLLTLEFVDKDTNIFETFTTCGAIAYDDDIVDINFGKFCKV